jgi:aminoglycoside phosphotransferase (APT) family kinase protein
MSGAQTALGEVDRLRARVAEVLSVDDLDLELIEGGRSNLTFVARHGSREWVVRRPPFGQKLATAHDMRREATVLRALAGSEVPVPRVEFSCDHFYVMERVDGRVIRSARDFDLSSPDARRCSEALVATLAALHGLPFASLGLEGFGRPVGFMQRQLDRWHEQLARGRARPLPELDELGRRLVRSLPVSGPPAIVHGDYRIDNVMLDEADPGRIVAVLDWEMATIGDPLADLGMLLLGWGEAGETFVTDVQELMAQPGFMRRAEVVDAYAALSGRDLGSLDWYVAFAHFKLGAIVEGIHARHLAGDTVGGGFEGIGEVGPRLAARGLELAA